MNEEDKKLNFTGWRCSTLTPTELYFNSFAPERRSQRLRVGFGDAVAEFYLDPSIFCNIFSNKYMFYAQHICLPCLKNFTKKKNFLALLNIAYAHPS